MSLFLPSLCHIFSSTQSCLWWCQYYCLLKMSPGFSYPKSDMWLSRYFASTGLGTTSFLRVSQRPTLSSSSRMLTMTLGNKCIVPRGAGFYKFTFMQALIEFWVLIYQSGLDLTTASPWNTPLTPSNHVIWRSPTLFGPLVPHSHNKEWPDWISFVFSGSNIYYSSRLIRSSKKSD